MIAPLSLIVTAFAPCADVRQTLTPQLRRDDEKGETELILIDLGQGSNRLGGSALAQVYGVSGDVPPDADAELLKAFFAVDPAPQSRRHASSPTTTAPTAACSPPSAK